MKYVSRLLLFAVAIIVGSSIGIGQAKLGMDIYSHYIWRGADLSAQSMQPSLSYAIDNLTIGAWGSFSINGLYNENDLYVSYSVPLSSGSIGVSVTDYYIPFFLPATATFFNYNSKTGSHAVEAGVSYTGGESFPISLSGYYNFIGGIMDPDNSSFIQVSYPILSDLSLSAGFTPSKSTAWYTTAKAGVCHIGVTASKTIKITDSFSLPVNAQYIMNPYAEKSYLIFGISL